MQAVKLKWAQKLEKEASDAINPHMLRVSKIISQEYDRLIMDPGQYLGISIPRFISKDGTHLDTATRWGADRYSIAEISEYTDKFVEEVRKGSRETTMIADAQDWDEKKFDNVKGAISKDVSVHTADIVKILNSYEAKITGAKNYKELLGSVAMMRNELRLIAEEMFPHIMLLQLDKRD